MKKEPYFLLTETMIERPKPIIEGQFKYEAIEVTLRFRGTGNTEEISSERLLHKINKKLEYLK